MGFWFGNTLKIKWILSPTHEGAKQILGSY
jgi:hypothetical protein